MKTLEIKDNSKKVYSKPEAVEVCLDRQISLAMSSAPPVMDDETNIYVKKVEKEIC